MPFPNFHAARAVNPDNFVRIVQLQELPNGVRILGGPLKTDPRGSGKPQSYRFPISGFTASEARKWLSDHDITVQLFEPATGEKDTYENYAPQYITNVSKDRAEINLFDEIGNGGISGQAFADEIQILNNFGVKEIHININSPGGSIIEGFSIFSAIRNSEVEVHTHIVGIAASMAGVIAMAGAKITMVDFGKLMIHNPSGSSDPNENEQNALDSLKDSLLTIFKNRTKKSKSELSDIMDNETWLNAKDALNGGFIDEIVSDRHLHKGKRKRQPVAEIVNILNMDFLNGSSLAALLNRTIDSKATENKSRTDIIEEIGRAAGISASTVGQILRGEINCPPIRRLEGFSRALDISMGRIRSAAESDGCEFNADGENINCALTPNILQSITNTSNTEKMKELCKYLNLSDDATEASIIEAVKKINDKLTEVTSTLETKETELTEATDKVTAHEVTIKQFEDKQTEMTESLVNETVDKAKEDGVIPEDKVEEIKDHYKNDVTGLKLILGNLRTPAEIISDKLKGESGDAEVPEDRKDWSFRKWEQEDEAGLDKIKNGNSKLYAKMYKAEYDVELVTA